ncbi:DUF3168 domain-containing protein [Hymenobacter setariae]|uniref:DUF3168 domain-containing protein n=1 Tax=Hymenobacter setariae TaxID=2594794 RepID=A0A558C353_9BACT|nr:DUF3168 domain-containing protein [Hymenobacter setariae]
MVEAGAILNTLLSQAAPVVALLGYVDKDHQQQVRIYPVVAPQKTPRPYCTYQLVSLVPEAGSSAVCRLGDVGRVQLSLYADAYDTLAALTTAVRGALDYAEPEPGVFLEPDNQQDHHDKDAVCLFRSLDYLVELP